MSDPEHLCSPHMPRSHKRPALPLVEAPRSAFRPERYTLKRITPTSAVLGIRTPRQVHSFSEAGSGSAALILTFIVV